MLKTKIVILTLCPTCLIVYLPTCCKQPLCGYKPSHANSSESLVTLTTCVHYCGSISESALRCSASLRSLVMQCSHKQGSGRFGAIFAGVSKLTLHPTTDTANSKGRVDGVWHFDNIAPRTERTDFSISCPDRRQRHPVVAHCRVLDRIYVSIPELSGPPSQVLSEPAQSKNMVRIASF